MKFAIAGGTGTVGAHVTRIAVAAGHEVQILSRSRGQDLVTGAGVDLTGVDVVIDVSGPSGELRKDPLRYFTTAARTLALAELDAGVTHHVALSIVGAAGSPFGYYAGKAAQERLVASGDVPWTILRTTQFYEFAEAMAQPFGPWLLAPRVRSQPIAAASVAARLVALAEAGPQGNATDLAGPREMRIAELLRTILRHRHRRTPVIEIPLPGGFGRALRNGAILPAAGADIDPVTVEQWLAQA